MGRTQSTRVGPELQKLAICVRNELPERVADSTPVVEKRLKCERGTALLVDHGLRVVNATCNAHPHLILGNHVPRDLIVARCCRLHRTMDASKENSTLARSEPWEAEPRPATLMPDTQMA